MYTKKETNASSHCVIADKINIQVKIKSQIMKRATQESFQWAGGGLRGGGARGDGG